MSLARGILSADTIKKRRKKMLAVLITMPILFFVFYFLCAVKEENLHLVIQGFFQALVLYVTG
ncbi:MAG: hypothetical protein IKB99_00820, partial [Lentisphaeria bacterium]|nr:hypothetical protein [Lentisphaeria bacterium]